MLVQWKQIEEVLRKDQFQHAQVCPACKERYEPCISVGIIGFDVIHLVPCVLVNEYTRYPMVFTTFCRQEYRYMYIAFGKIVFSPCADGNFLAMLVQRYHMLLNTRLTESAFRKAGCNLEAEWALWQMGGE